MATLPTEYEQVITPTQTFYTWFSDSMNYILFQSMRKMLIGLGEEGDRIIADLDSNHKEVDRFCDNLRRAINTGDNLHKK